MSGQTYTIGTRSSPLAMWQAQYVQWLLEEHWPEDHFSIVGITTTGDDQTIDISKEGGKGLYVKELEKALIENRVDICVHSLKDFPVDPAIGCDLAAVIERGEVRDVLISHKKVPLDGFNSEMIIGTSSLRRNSQLRMLGVESKIENIRGNVDTRIQKVRSGEVHGIILAAAGVLRLGLENEVTSYFPPTSFIPAPGQGAIGVECRQGDEDLRFKLRRIHDDESGQAVGAERAFLRKLGGNCSLPLGAWCEIEQFQMKLHAFLSLPNGEMIMMDRAVAPIGHGEPLGENMADRFFAQGAERILKRLEEDSKAS